MLVEVRALMILQDRDRRLLALAKDLEKLPQDEARAKTKLAGDEAAVTRAHDRTLVAEDLAAIAQRRERLESECREVATERETLASHVPEAVLPLYQRLMKSKNGLAVAPMRDATCGGCHMKLIASTVVAVQSAREIVRCEDCGRILYVED